MCKNNQQQPRNRQLAISLTRFSSGSQRATPPQHTLTHLPPLDSPSITAPITTTNRYANDDIRQFMLGILCPLAIGALCSHRYYTANIPDRRNNFMRIARTLRKSHKTLFSHTAYTILADGRRRNIQFDLFTMADGIAHRVTCVDWLWQFSDQYIPWSDCKQYSVKRLTKYIQLEY